MTPEQEKLAWARHRQAQLRQWREMPFRQKLQCLEEMHELAKHMEEARQRSASSQSPMKKPLGA